MNLSTDWINIMYLGTYDYTVDDFIPINSNYHNLLKFSLNNGNSLALCRNVALQAGKSGQCPESSLLRHEKDLR